MDKMRFNEIKQKALENHIPIIMDDTLDVLEERFKNSQLNSILEIGTAVRLFGYLFFEIFVRKSEKLILLKEIWKEEMKLLKILIFLI